VQAVLRFHPDRQAGAGVREKVEAEEKFKIISRKMDEW
jgi:curved DNA-binding protein CbpA